MLKTNLFQGDRVQLSASYINTKRHKNTRVGTRKLKFADRRGTIVSDTTHPEAETIIVWWDGSKRPDEARFRHDRGYMPDELVLVEEEENGLENRHAGRGGAGDRQHHDRHG